MLTFHELTIIQIVLHLNFLFRPGNAVTDVWTRETNGTCGYQTAGQSTPAWDFKGNETMPACIGKGRGKTKLTFNGTCPLLK